jgi:L-seryl-tRNA(Ser) seleniumtransferase
MKKHQLLRALRVDKMTLAAFDATLRIYLSGGRKEIPVVGMIEADKNVLLKKARVLCRVLKSVVTENASGFTASYDFTISVVETCDAVGGGAYPTDALPGFGVEIRSGTVSAETLAKGLKTARVPVIPAVRDGGVILHVRTLLSGDEQLVADSFAAVLKGLRPAEGGGSF